jgi:hypothetical protein
MRNNTKIFIVASLVVLQVNIAAAQTESESPLTDRIFTCTNQSVSRTVKIQYPDGTALPCRVVYDKSQEGSEVQNLWQATTEEGYCEDKAETFVNKLTDWGWSCSEGQ